MNNFRELYVVKTKKGGFVSTRRNVKFATVVYSNMSFKRARIFTRIQDAKAACEKKGDVVMAVKAELMWEV